MGTLKARIQHLILKGIGEKPIAAPEGVQPGDSEWRSYYIMIGEWAYNLPDDIWYYNNGTEVKSFGARSEIVDVENTALYDAMRPNDSNGFAYYAGKNFVTYVNESSANPDFHEVQVYLCIQNAEIGESPESHPLKWENKGEGVTISSRNTSTGVVASLAELKAIEGMKTGDSVIVTSVKYWYRFTENAETGIKPNDGSIGSWIHQSRFNGSNLIDVVDSQKIENDFYLPYRDDCLIVLVPGMVGMLDATQIQFYITITEPSFIVKTGSGFTPADYKIQPFGVGGGNTNDKQFFVTEALLRAAHPVGEEGWFSLVGETDTFWVWDVEGGDWVDSGSHAASITIDAVPTNDSPNAVSSGGVFAELGNKADAGHQHTATDITMSDGKTVEQAVNETRSQHVDFSVNIPFTSIMTSMPITASDEERVFIPITATAVAGARCMVVMNADGTELHVPGFSSIFKTAPDSMGWNNINNSRNAIEFWYDGTDYWYKIIREESNLVYKSEVILKGGASGPFTPVHDDDPVPKKWTEDTIRQVVANYYPGLPSPDGLDLGWYGVEWDEGRVNPGCLRIGSLSGYAGGGAYGDNGYNINTRPLSNVPDHLLFVHNKMKSVMLLDSGTENYDLDPYNNYNRSGVAPTVMDVVTADGRTVLNCTGLFAGVEDDYVGRYAHNTTLSKTSRYALITGKTNNDTLVISDPRTGSPSSNIFEIGDSFEICTARFDGDDGQVMVKIPKFYFFQTYEPSPTGISGRSKVRIGLSMYPYDGFTVHPAFVDGTGSQVDAIYVSRLEAINIGGTLASLPNSIPANSTNLPTFRGQAQNRGAGWQLEMFWYRSALQLLFYTEYADLFSQHRLQAFTEGANSSAWRRRGGRTLHAGNQSVSVVANDWYDADIVNSASWGEHKTVAMSYRGIENFYGHLWTCVDGINVNERNVYVTNNKAVLASDTPAGYDDLGVALPSNSYLKTIHSIAGAIVPATGGASTVTYYTDYAWSSVGWRVCFAGGHLSYGAYAGVAALRADLDSTFADWSIGARLCY